MKNPILKNKAYLYLTEFFAGMSVMAVELGASRLLAPYSWPLEILWVDDGRIKIRILISCTDV